MKKLFLNILIIAFVTILATHTVYAANEYKLLAPIGSLEKVSTESSGFSSYLQSMVNVAIGVAAAASVMMLIVGGLQYVLSSVSETAKKDAKDRITNAIFGLLFALSGYILLKTINPDLLNIGLPSVNPLPAITPTKVENITQPPSFTPEEQADSAEITACMERARQTLENGDWDKGNVTKIAEECSKNPSAY